MPTDAPRGLPIDLRGWIADNAESFEPPVSNKVVWRDSDHIFMVIRGPNARTDFHIDPFDEVFMQLQGSIRVDLMVDGTRQQHWIREGEIMLVPGNVPHAPLRPPDTWGVVIERPRHGDELDSLVWFCEVCDAEVRKVTFLVRDIEVELAQALRAYNADPALRTCPNGHVNAVPGPFDGTAPQA